VTDIDLSSAERIVDAALAHAESLQLAPLTVAVLDKGGHLVCLKRQDQSGILRADIAVAKAWGVLGMGLPSDAFLERAHMLPEFFASLAALSNGRMLPVRGGVPVRNNAGDLVGAVGISGDTSENDEACAVHGIEAAQLRTWLR